MKTKFLLLATIGTLFLATACTNDDVTTDDVQAVAEEEMPIGFDTYLSSNSQGDTRAVYTVGVNHGLFQAAELTDNGFGIFAYLQDGTAATSTFTGTPNFMYDQHVTYSASNWTYSPLKYWPNMTTNDGRTGNSATMTKTQSVNFFAYAPYIPTATDDNSDYLNSADGIVKDKNGTERTTGITHIVANTGDAAAPTITYVVNGTNAADCTDLLWATAPLGGLRYNTVQSGMTVNIDAGMPLVNLIKPDTQTKLKFSFQHALTAMGMTIQLAVDQVAGGGTLDSNTKVYVESITLVSGKKGETEPTGFATKGKLNLWNTAAFTPRWEKIDEGTGTWNQDLTISASGYVTINTALTANNTGVTTTPTRVFGTDAAPYLMFIPVLGEAGDLPVTVTVTYKVVTTDGNYTSGTVETNNAISNTVTLKNFKAGRLYNLKLVLGLTSVKIDAEAQDWAVEEQVIDLPRNLE